MDIPLTPSPLNFHTTRLHLRRSWQSIREVVGGHPDSILVWQMAKVGSTTVCKSLRDAELIPLHLHFVSHNQWERSATRHFDTGKNVLPRHFYRSWAVRQYLHLTNHRLKIISLVRDPISRFVSSCFQVPELHAIDITSSKETAREVEHQITQNADFSYVFSWFDREFIPTIELDIFSHPFNRSDGFGKYQAHRADVLIVQVEKLDSLMPTVMADFVGKPLKITRGNVRANTDEGNLYRAVRDSIQLSPAICSAVYDTRWMKYFYSDDQTQHFTERWTMIK